MDKIMRTNDLHISFTEILGSIPSFLGYFFLFILFFHSFSLRIFTKDVGPIHVSVPYRVRANPVTERSWKRPEKNCLASPKCVWTALPPQQKLLSAYTSPPYNQGFSGLPRAPNGSHKHCNHHWTSHSANYLNNAIHIPCKKQTTWNPWCILLAMTYPPLMFHGLRTRKQTCVIGKS